MTKALYSHDGAIRRSVVQTPWYYGWNVIAVAMLYQAVVWGIGMSCFTYFVTPWMGAFHVGRAQVMIAVSLEILLVGGLAPIAGRFVDRVSTTLLVTMAALSFAVGMFLISIATALWQIVAVYTVLLSLGMTFAGPLTGTTLAVRWFRARRGIALGLVLSGSPIGAIVLPPLITGWIAHSGWRMTHVFLALICAALAPIVLLVVRGSPESAGVAAEADNPRSAALAVEHAGKTWTMMQVVRTPAVWIIVFAFLPFSIVNLGVQSNIAPFAKDLGFSLQQAGRLIPVIGVLGLASKFFYGALADRIDTRMLFYFSALCIGAGVALMITAPGYPVMLLACALFSFGEGAALLLIGAIVAARFGPNAYGTAIGIVYFFVMTLAGAGPVIGGYLRDVTGSYSAMFSVMLALLVPAIVAMSLLRSGHRRGEAPALAPGTAAE
jgi:MFS family permease